MPGRARLVGHHHDGRRRSGPASPAAPSCTTTRPRPPWSWPPSSTWPSGAAEEIRAEAAALPAPARERLDRVIDMLAAAFTGPLFVAALEVWVAARTDPELRAALVPLEARVGREMHRLDRRPARRRRARARRPRGRAGHPRPAARARRGQPAHRRLRPPPRAARRVEAPARHRSDRRGDARGRPRRDCSPTSPTSRPTSTAPVGRPAGRRDWARPTPGRRLDDRAPDRPPGLDRPASRCSPSPTRTPSSPQLADGRRPTRTRFVDRGAAGVPGAAGRAAGPLAGRPGRAGRGAARRARRARKLPWFGTAMSPASMATARIMETWAHGQDVADALGVTARADRPAAARRATSASARSGTASLAHGRPAPDGAGPGRAGRAGRRRCGRSGPDDAADRVDRPGARLLPAGHPAPAPRRPRPGGDRAGRRRVARRRPGLRRPARAGPRSRPATGRDACCGSATRPASTATGSPPGGRCSTAAPLDVLTGDYLAELTMLILGRDRLKDPRLGYAKTFLRQMEAVPRHWRCDRGVRDRHQRRRAQPGRAGRRAARRSPTGSASTSAIGHVEGDARGPCRTR